MAKIRLKYLMGLIMQCLVIFINVNLSIKTEELDVKDADQKTKMYEMLGRFGISIIGKLP